MLSGIEDMIVGVSQEACDARSEVKVRRVTTWRIGCTKSPDISLPGYSYA